jgi:hypothetical protein
MSGRPGVKKGTRLLVVPRLPYIVLRRVQGETVEINGGAAYVSSPPQLKCDRMCEDGSMPVNPTFENALDQEDSDISLSPEQVAEIECCLSDDEPFASDEEVRAVFAHLTK